MSVEKAEEIKLLVLGDSGVGKSCIVHRYVEGKFAQNVRSTLGVEFKQKAVKINDKRHII